MLTGDGKLRIATPRDRDGSFEPLLVPKHARRFTAFDDSIVALYARGLTVREIQGYLAESYGTEVSPDLIGTVTDGVLAEVTGWQARACYRGGRRFEYEAQSFLDQVLQLAASALACR